MTIVSAFWATLLGMGLLGCLILRARLTRRVLRRAGRRFERRLSAALVAGTAYVVLCRWLPRHRPAVRPVDLTRPDYLAACPLAAAARQGRPAGVPGTCRWCARALPDRAKVWCTAQCRIVARSNHEFSFARDAALQRDSHRCVRPGCGTGASFERAIEVNHKTLIHGRHNQAGCWHHLDGLESLCGRHHDQVTAQQRARGWAA